MLRRPYMLLRNGAPLQGTCVVSNIWVQGGSAGNLVRKHTHIGLCVVAVHLKSDKSDLLLKIQECSWCENNGISGNHFWCSCMWIYYLTLLSSSLSAVMSPGVVRRAGGETEVPHSPDPLRPLPCCCYAWSRMSPMNHPVPPMYGQSLDLQMK